MATEGPALAARLQSDLRALAASVADAEQAVVGRSLLASTRDDVVELALVRAMGLFEEFLGELFILALLNKLGGEVAPLMPVDGPDQALLMVAGVDGSEAGRYVSWLPVAGVLKRAERLLAHAEPFRRLAARSSEKNALVDLVVVRNRAAHDSASARERFVRLASQKGYPSTRAADYLVSTRHGLSEITHALQRLEAIATGLAEPSEAVSRVVLQTEDPYAANQVAPAGDYECSRCGLLRRIVSFSTLGECTSCPAPVACTQCGKRSARVSQWVRAV